MKQLLVMLVDKINPPWWRMRSSEGDPPEEREGHYILSALQRMIINKLKQVEKDHAEIDP